MPLNHSNEIGRSGIRVRRSNSVTTVAVELLHREQTTDCRLYAPATGMNEIVSVAIAKNDGHARKWAHYRK